MVVLACVRVHTGVATMKLCKIVLAGGLKGMPRLLSKVIIRLFDFLEALL